MHLLKEQKSHPDTLECLARYILSIAIDRMVDSDYKLGKPMNEYEYDNCVSNFKVTDAYVFSAYTSADVLQTLRIVVRKTILANKERLVYASGGKHTDRFVYVFNEKTIVESDVFAIDGTIVFGDKYFVCYFEEKQSIPLRYLSARMHNNFESISAIIVDHDDIFDLPHGYKHIEYPLLTDMRLHKTHRLMKSICYDPVYGMYTHAFAKKYPGKTLLAYTKSNIGIEQEHIHWAKWENLKPLKYSMQDPSIVLKSFPTYGFGERVYCALTGVEIAGDCYVLEARSSWGIADPATYHIVVAPIFFLVIASLDSGSGLMKAFGHFKSNFRWICLRSYCPTPVENIIRELVDAEDVPLYLSIDASVVPADLTTWCAKDVDGADILMSRYNGVYDIVERAAKSDSKLLIYDAECLSSL